jgi:hypothetical protein
MAYDLIEKVTVATATATVNFATLPTTYKDLKVFISGRSDNNSRRIRCYMTINNNTNNTDYIQYEWYQEDNALGAEMNTSGSETRAIGVVPALTMEANIFGATEVWLYDYNNATRYQGVTGWSGCPRQDNTGYDLWQTGNTWLVNNAVTNLSFYLGAGNWIANSTFYLYGQK